MASLQVDSPLVATTPMKPLYPPMEQIFSLSRSLSVRISRVLRSYFSCGRARRDAKKWSGGPYHCDTPIKTRIRHLSMPASSLKKLMERCHREDSTITPFLQTLVGKTLCETFEAAGRLRCAVAISLRRFMPPQLQIGDDAMGLWVSAFHVEYSRTQLLGRENEGGESKQFWDEVRKNSQRIRQEIKKRDRDLSTGMLRYIPDFRSMLVNKMGQKRDDSFAITNIGCFNGEPGKLSRDLGDDPSQLCISNLLFSQSCHVNGSALQFCIVSVKDGDMNIAISWQEGIVSVEDVERVAEALSKALEFCN
jgi:Alcohol acetyltransferase